MTFWTYTKYEADTNTHSFAISCNQSFQMARYTQQWFGSALSRWFPFKLDSDFHFLITQWQNLGISWWRHADAAIYQYIYIFFHRFTQFQPSQASSAGVASGFRRRSLTFPYQYCLVVTFSYMIGHKSIAKTQITKQNLYAGQISWAHAIPCPTFAMFREIFTSTWDLGGLFPSQIGQRLLHQGDRSSLRGQKSEDHRGDAVAGLWQKRALPRLLRL